MLRLLSICHGFCLHDILHSSCKYSQFLCFCKTYFKKKVILCLTFFRPDNRFSGRTVTRAAAQGRHAVPTILTLAPACRHHPFLRLKLPPAAIRQKAAEWCKTLFHDKTHCPHPISEPPEKNSEPPKNFSEPPSLNSEPRKFFSEPPSFAPGLLPQAPSRPTRSGTSRPGGKPTSAYNI